MSNPPPPTQISRILTQVRTQVRTAVARVNFGALALRNGAVVPELRIKGNQSQPDQVYPLLGDRYVIGRSSQCDIVVRNQVVSQTHCSIRRNDKQKRSFIIKDKDSTNGIFWGKKRVKVLDLYHGDTITLGPPELADAVEVTFHNPPPWWIYALRYGLYGAGGFLTLAIAIVGWQWTKYSVYPLPKGVKGPSVVYARDQKTILNPVVNESHRELKKLSDFSPYLPKALVASEDSRYYWHFGVDPYGITRAVLINLQKDGISQGASTITQQVARSLFPEVGRENTAGRKLREMIVALKLEAFYSKDEILKTYLNRVYLGVGSYGFEDAAQFYFDKSAADLDISEAATLVAILPAPNSYNPVRDYETALSLRNRVIMRMLKLRMISQQEADNARRSRIEVSKKAKDLLSNQIAPYFYSYVFQEMETLLGRDFAQEGNLIIETGLDLNAQKKMENSLRQAVETKGAAYNFSQGAMVTLNSRSGEIIALTGGVNYAKSQFNRATGALRQPGSTFKVFAYAAALEANISPSKLYSCAPLTWKGQRYKGCERSSGSINMYRGMAQSENAVALRVAQDVGLDAVISMAQRLGITSKLRSSPGLILGESEVNVLEITGSYATFANGGVWNRPHAIRRILDSGNCTDPDNYQTCKEIFSFEEDGTREGFANVKALSPNVANNMTNLLQGVVQGGTGKAANIGLGEAGKTGTTNKGVDLWFIGYIPNRQLVTGVWLGNDDNTPTKTSSGQAAALWGQYMGDLK